MPTCSLGLLVDETYYECSFRVAVCQEKDGIRSSQGGRGSPGYPQPVKAQEDLKDQYRQVESLFRRAGAPNLENSGEPAVLHNIWLSFFVWKVPSKAFVGTSSASLHAGEQGCKDEEDSPSMRRQPILQDTPSWPPGCPHASEQVAASRGFQISRIWAQ